MSFSFMVIKEILKLDLGLPYENYGELLGISTFNNRLNCSKKIIKNISQKKHLLIENIEKSKTDFILSFNNTLSSDDLLKEIKHFINYPGPESDLFLSYFLRGVFLGCGSVTNPISSYYLEFLVKEEWQCDLLISILKNVKVTNLNPKIARRKSSISIYMKGNSQITDFLTFIGATNSSMEFIQIKMLKEVRNYVNRTTNFETANLTKTTLVASEQIKSIEKIVKTKGIDFLPFSLRETALLRLQNPYMSLEELSHLFSRPITKSGVNYRIKKLLKYIDSVDIE